jgi:hypothetical protein
LTRARPYDRGPKHQDDCCKCCDDGLAWDAAANLDAQMRGRALKYTSGMLRTVHNSLSGGKFMNRTPRWSVFAAVSVVALAFGLVLTQASAAETDDYYIVKGVPSTGSVHVTGTSSKTVFSVPPTGGITVTCTHSAAGGTPPARAAGLAAFAISPLPVFNDGKTSTGTIKPCTDNLGGTETTTTNNLNGKWTIREIDNASETETSVEPNSGDRLVVIVPKAGAIVKTSEGCTITVAPSGAVAVFGAYTDGVNGVYRFTVAITNLPIHVSGGAACPTAATTSSFHAVYTFTPAVRDGS